MKGTGMKPERGTESVKLFCPTETFIRGSTRPAKDTDRYDTGCVFVESRSNPPLTPLQFKSRLYVQMD